MPPTLLCLREEHLARDEMSVRQRRQVCIARRELAERGSVTPAVVVA